MVHETVTQTDRKTTGARVAVGALVGVALLGAVFALVRLRSGPGKQAGLGETFTYDVQALRETDPRLIIYRESEKLSTGFDRAVAVAVGPGDLTYVAGDRSVRAFDQSGRSTLDIPLTDAPRCLAVSGDGDIFVGVRDRVEVYTDKGALRDQWPSFGPQSLITSIAVSRGHVFVADAGRRQVMHHLTTGEPVNVIGKKDEAEGVAGFVVPHPHFDLAFGSDGLLRVANPGRHRIEFYTPEGSLELWWGEVSMGIEGFAGCGNPVNFALLQDGRVVTCEKGLPRVKIYSPQGIFAGVVAGAELFPGYNAEAVSRNLVGELDVAVDSSGRILVLEPAGRVVRVFVPNEAS